MLARRDSIRILIGFLAILTFLAGLSAVQAQHHSATTRAGRLKGLPPPAQLLAAAQRAGICVERIGPGVSSVHAREKGPSSVSVKRLGSGTEVSAVAGGNDEKDMDQLVEAYRASGQSPELYEAVTEALDLGVIAEASLRC